jgi:hypothetical protein
MIAVYEGGVIYGAAATPQAMSGALFAGHPSTRRAGSLAGRQTVDRPRMIREKRKDQALDFWKELPSCLPSPHPELSDLATGQRIPSHRQDLKGEPAFP